MTDSPNAADRRRSAPPGWLEDHVAMDDGWLLRVGSAGPPAPARATVLLLNGRGDFLEKYWETMHDLADRGYRSISLDWRGQGASGRLGDTAQKCHADDFARLVADAAHLLDHHWAREGSALFLIGHSMGGNLAARLLMARGQRFRAAALLAPMFGIQAGPIPLALLRRLVRLMVQRGRAMRYAFGQTPYGPAMRTPLRRDRLTHDRRRFDDEHWFMEQRPQLQLGGVTFGWLAAALQSIELVMAPGAPESIALPVLLMLPDQEQLVDPTAARAFAARLSRATLVDVPGARHELLRETDAIRAAALEQLDVFYRTAQ